MNAEENNMTLGERIVYLRNKINMTQGQLASEIGVSRQMLNKYETDRADPRLFIALCMAGALDVSLDYLVRGKNYGE